VGPLLSLYVTCIATNMIVTEEESDEEGIAPRRKRRMAEKAAAGEVEDEEVRVHIISILIS
jgi:hypothetical protein